jgi:hypothetical protein
MIMFRKFLLPLLVPCALLFASSAPASAETLQPWFHLSSGARPTYLHAGVAVREVQELTVNATKGDVLAQGEGHYVVFPFDGTPGVVQSALEEAFGAGNVEVSGQPGDYSITFKGTVSYQSVPPVTSPTLSHDACYLGLGPSVECLQGEANATITTPAKPDGELIATVVNVGDAEAGEGCVEVPAETGRYKDAACTEEGGEPSENDYEKKNPPVEIADTLPPGLQAVSAQLISDESAGDEHSAGSCSVSSPQPHSLQQVKCTVEGSVAPFEQVEVRIGVVVQTDAKECEPSEAAACETNQLAIAGGGARGVPISRPVTISSSPEPFGVQGYELTPEEAGGAVDTQAGSHPFQLTTTFALNQTAGGAGRIAEYETQPVALAKDLDFKLPPGLVGNPHPFARCTLAQFTAFEVKCPPDTVLGVAVVTVGEPTNLGLFTRTAPLYNLEPQTGEPARFGFRPTNNTPVFLDTSVRTGEDYGVTVSAPNITQDIGFVANTVTFWGVPGKPEHDGQRGTNCLYGSTNEATGPCQPLEAVNPPPFLDLPGSCTNEPLHTEVLSDSWDAPGDVLAFASPMPQLDGCGELPFHASIEVKPDVSEASKPSGLTVDVHVPQEEALNAEGLAPTELKNITVTLPEGVDLNPSAADGLAACPLLKGREPAQEEREAKGEVTGINLESHQQPHCPEASKIATVEIETPLLPKPLKGFVYLASPQNFRGALPENPFSSLVAMYLVAYDEESGTLVKLPGSVSLNQSTGQITSTFADNPQLPFEDAKLEFFGGERAPLATPQHCGAYTSEALFEPWSAEPADEAALRLHESSTFDITSGPGGTACPGSSLPFSPSLVSDSTNIDAGAFSNLSTTLSRSSSDQPLQSVTLHYPAGLSGLLSGVALCGEGEANAGTCGPGSQIGETVVSVGVGGEPFTVTGGKVYITGPYHGAPFGLSIVNPAKAGPYDLQEGRPVVVRARIEVDPLTAALTVVTNSPGEGYSIPHIIEGFELQIQHVNVLINRPGFTFNPTNCTPAHVTGAISSSEGAAADVETPFQVTNCAALKFTPKFSVSTSGKTSKADGASLDVKLSYPKTPQGTEANVKSVKVELPKALPSQLKTLQKACTQKQFQANPAGCPAESVVGHAIVHTQVLPVPLEGPAYFVSNGGEAFPNLIIVLQGNGVTVDLVGDTDIKNGVTSSTFAATPDVPFETFELKLPQGKYSALAANGNLCRQKLTMPTEFKAQNGATLDQSTHIEVEGCADTISVVSHKVKGKTITLKVAVPGGGKVKVSGKGLSSTSKSVGGRETVTVTVHQKKGGKLHTKVKLSFKPSKGSSQSKSVTVEFKK